MNYMKLYPLSFCMVTIFSLSSMVPSNSDITLVNETNFNKEKTEPKIDFLNNNKNKLKEYLYNFEEERLPQITEQVNNIHRRIDADHLGVTKDTYLKRLVGSWRSFCKNIYLTDAQAVSEMNQIESYITEDKELVLEKLEQKHWYVNYLFQALVQTKIKEIEKVKGSTIDVLYNPMAEEGFQKMVHVRALQKYFDDSRIKRSLFYGVPMGKLGDIHWAVLCGHKNNIDSTCLSMSSNGRYLRSISKGGGETIIWDMLQGTQTNLTGKEESIFGDTGWIKTQHEIIGDEHRCVIDKADNYFAEVLTQFVETGENNPSSSLEEFYSPSKFPVVIEKSGPVIMLFNRPQEISHLSQEAFYSSKDNCEELIALRNSKSFDAIEGYPKNNLEKRIEKRIQELSSTSKL